MANLNKVNNEVVVNTISQINLVIGKGYEQRRADEKLFLMGVKLGRVLAEQGVEDVRLDFFVNQELATDCLEQAMELCKQMDEIAKAIVIDAITAQVEEHGVWSVGPGSHGKDEFSLGVANKYNLQVKWSNQSHTDDNIDIVFAMTGRLADEIKRHGFEPEISAEVFCFEGKSVDLYRESSVADDIGTVRFSFSWKPTVECVNRLKALKDALTKMYVFELAAR